ncbi:hypothetical protein Hanom_Chr01g00032231 [Helianthus anomalus]
MGILAAVMALSFVESRFPAVRGDLLMDYHVLNSTKRKKSLFIKFLPNTQNRFFAISKHNNQIIRMKKQSQTPP